MQGVLSQIPNGMHLLQGMTAMQPDADVLQDEPGARLTMMQIVDLCEVF